MVSEKKILRKTRDNEQHERREKVGLKSVVKIQFLAKLRIQGSLPRTKGDFQNSKLNEYFR